MKKAILILVLTIICLAFGTAYLTATSVICADANGDNKVNLSDISYTINYLYRSGPVPDPLKAADPDNSNKINLLDVSYTINYLYRGGPRPVCSKYLGQLPPDSVPQVFAPGLISTSDMEFTASFDPSFQEFYFTRRGTDNINKIYYSKIVDGHWSNPAIAPFCDGYFYMEPLLSPDGQKLYFSSNRPCSGCIFANWYVTKSGSTWSDPQTLGAPFNSIMMMYTTQSSNGNLYFTNISAAPVGIYLSRFVDGAYQTPERLGTTINKGYNEAHPYIAPDESYMIFDAQNRPGGVGGSDLYISYRNDDGSWTESINLGSNINTTGEDLAPTVSPDGEYFFYARPNGLKHDIYWCNTAFIEKLRPCTGTIAYTITPSNGNNQIHTINCDGTDLQQLTTLPGRNMGPDWSPDGSKIAYYTHHDADNTWSIYVMDADGGNVTRLTSTTGDWDWSPQWSPDGTKLLFARMYPSDYHSDIWMMNADGSDLHRVGSVIGFGPKWSSDGEKIIYSGLAGEYEIFSMDTSGANQVQLTDNSAEDYWPSWSPDGSKILFVSNRDGNFEVYTINADGTTPVRLTTSSQNEDDAKWSPDGSSIAYISWLTGHMEIYTMKTDGSQKTRLTYNASDHAFDPDWKQ